MSNTINPQRALCQATLVQEGSRGSLLPQLTQLLVRTRSSTLHGNSFLYKAVPASTRSSGECCTSQSIGKCTTRAASKLLWTLTLRVWWHQQSQKVSIKAIPSSLLSIPVGSQLLCNQNKAALWIVIFLHKSVKELWPCQCPFNNYLLSTFHIYFKPICLDLSFLICKIRINIQTTSSCSD